MKHATKIICYIFLFVIGIPALALAGSATLHWQANTEPDLAGYRIYYGTSSRSYGPYIPVDKNTTSYTINNLTEGQTYYFALTAVDTSGNESGYSQEVSKSIASTSGDQATVVANVSVSPSSGSVAAGSRQAFEAVYECSTGAPKLKAVFLMLNKKLRKSKGIYLKYSVADNKIYLRTNSGKRWKGGYAPGSNNVIENKNGRVYCAATSVQQNGTTLRVTWVVKPFKDFAGTRKLYMKAKAQDGTASNWEKMGTVSITNNTSN